jgi:acetyl esterase
MPVILDPDASAVFQAMKAANRPPYDTLPHAEAREMSKATRAAVQPDPPAMASVETLRIPAPHGAIPLRVYKPLTLRKAATAPGLVFYHGGGWVIGDLESHDVVCRQIATEAAIIVAAVDYRLAPEHKFPAAVDDCIAATNWVAANAERLGIDASRLYVGGDSAGGNLAAVVAMHARDHGGPRIRGQVLIYPVTDLAMTHASHGDPDTGVLLTHVLMRWFRDHYLAHPSEIDDWRASPLRMANLKGLPPAFVLTVGADPLHDEGEEFAARLKQAGVAVTHVDYPGQFHAFITMGRILPKANRLIGEIGDWLKAMNQDVTDKFRGV